MVGVGQGVWGLTKGTVLALVARGASAGVAADVVLARPVVEAGLGGAWGATCQEGCENLVQVESSSSS